MGRRVGDWPWPRAHFWGKGEGEGRERHTGAQAGEQSPSAVVSQSRGRMMCLGWGTGGRGGRQCHRLPFPRVLELVFIPQLFILPLRVPSVLGVITENSVPHPFKFQAVKCLRPLGENYSAAPLSRKLLFCSLIFSSLLKSLSIPSLCPLHQTPHSPSLPGCLYHSPPFSANPHPRDPGGHHLAELHGFSSFNLFW